MVLDQVEIIGGSSQFLEYEVLDKNNEPLLLQNAEIKWTLCYIGQKESPILIKDNRELGGVTVRDNTFTVEILPNDTIDLYDGKYEQEPIIIQENGKVLRPSYGYIVIRKGSEY